MSRITYYHILGVSSDATEDEIAAAFRRKVKQWHPDICSHPDAEERMREINEAAEVLCDPERRARYNRAFSGKETFDFSTAGPAHGETEPGSERFQKFWSLGRAAAHFPFRVKSGTIRYAATGFTALIILVILIAAAWTAPPLISGSPGIPAADAIAQISAIPVPAEQNVDQLQEEGDQLYAAGNYEGALSVYNAIIEQNPSTTERDIWYNRGMAQNALGLYSDAAESFDHVLQVSPEDSFALAQKGAALMGLGQYEESLRYTDKALNAGSDTGWIWNNRGIALSGLGQQKEARTAFENAAIFTGQSGSALYQNIVLQPAVSNGF